MGYDSYDRAPAALGEVSVAQLQSSFVNRVFGWMTAGLGITGLVALGMNVYAADFIAKSPGLYIGLIIVQLVVVVGMTAAIRKISAAAATAGFIFFAALNGVTLSWIFLAYQMDSIAATFFTTSATFGAMGLIGWTTKRDLTGLGSLCFMGLIGLIVASVINMIWYNNTANLVISIFGVLIFVGLTAYDTQKIKQLAIAVGSGEIEAETGRKYAVIGALTLYLDFVNLFLYLLRLFGNRR